MTPEELAKVRCKFPVSETVARLSLGAGATKPTAGVIIAPAPISAKRIRQSDKPLLNKLEAEFYEIIRHRYPNYPPVMPQAVKLKLANNCWYCPDFFALLWPRDNAPSAPRAWEIKGKHAWDDALVKIKVAAAAWPDIRFSLHWKDNGAWQEQEILP